MLFLLILAQSCCIGILYTSSFTSIIAMRNLLVNYVRLTFIEYQPNIIDIAPLLDYNFM